MNGAKIKSEEYQGEGSFGTGDDTACEFNKTQYHWSYLLMYCIEPMMLLPQVIL